ncbi:MAG: glycosyltransferase family 2 protein [Clostridiales bacterium]|nr:glycosyltransferase family 2 protein [Clostridiales bacterium]
MLVSVIMPVYNVREYLERAVNSVLNQELQDFELILCDNSTDPECRELCRQLEKTHDRIKLLCLPMQCGPGVARNAGLDIARGKYIYFMDSDDCIKKNLLSDNVAIAEKYGCDMVKFGCTSLVANNNGKIVSKTDIIQSLEGLYSFDMLKKHFTEYLEGTPNSVCLRLYKNDSIQKIRFEDYTTAEDGIFNTDILINGIKSIYFNRKSYYYYIGRPSSIMGQYNPNRYQDELELLKHMERAVENWSNRDELMKKIDEMYLQSFLMEYNNFTHSSCDLKVAEAAKIVEDIYNRPEIQRALKSVSSIKKIPPSARISYILSVRKKFKAAVLFKRIYIPISYFINRLRMKI